MRVLTFNVQTDAGDPRRTGLINAALRRLAPDLVALQEVRRDDARDQLAELVAGTGLHTSHQVELIGPPPPGAEAYGGTAVATRLPHRVVDLREHRPARPDDVHWWTLAVTVAVPGTGDLLFVVPTTPWQPGAEGARVRQAAEVAGVHARYGATTVVAGDLNAGPDAESLRLLTGHGFRDAWAEAGDGPGWTWSVDNPLAAAEIERVLGRPEHRGRIDHVLVGPGPRITAARLVGDRPVEGVWLSDHAGVLVELEL
jgi:endonuclease/exonuclease/phosphatase family metal-dependent hydrolase